MEILNIKSTIIVFIAQNPVLSPFFIFLNKRNTCLKMLFLDIIHLYKTYISLSSPLFTLGYHKHKNENAKFIYKWSYEFVIWKKHKKRYPALIRYSLNLSVRYIVWNIISLGFMRNEAELMDMKSTIIVFIAEIPFHPVFLVCKKGE